MYRHLQKHTGATRTVGFDFGPQLLSGTETLTGTPTIAVSPSGLTVGTPAINSVSFLDVDNSRQIAADEGVLVEVSGGTAGVEYAVTVACGVAPDGEIVSETFTISVY